MKGFKEWDCYVHHNWHLGKFNNSHPPSTGKGPMLIWVEFQYRKVPGIIL